jgi:hypothetical protein
MPGYPIASVEVPVEVPPQYPLRVPGQQGVSVRERSSSLDATPKNKKPRIPAMLVD